MNSNVLLPYFWLISSISSVCGIFACCSSARLCCASGMQRSCSDLAISLPLRPKILSLINARGTRVSRWPRSVNLKLDSIDPTSANWSQRKCSDFVARRSRSGCERPSARSVAGAARPRTKGVRFVTRIQLAQRLDVTILTYSGQAADSRVSAEFLAHRPTYCMSGNGSACILARVLTTGNDPKADTNGNRNKSVLR